MSSATSRARDEVNDFRTLLTRLLSEDVKGEDAPPVRQRRISASNLIPVANRTIKNTEDIESLLNNIKSTLEGLLDDSDEVNID